MEGLVEESAAGAGQPATTTARSDGPATATETVLAEVVAELLSLDHVPVEDHFFDDLGADSMVMARVCARVRKRGDLPPMSIKDVYQHPTIRELSAALEDGAPTTLEPRVQAPVEMPPAFSTREYVVCGALQLLLFLGYVYIAALGVVAGYEWISAASGLPDTYARAVLVTVVGFVLLSAAPVLAKWALIGRWEPQRIRIWSLAYVRFWIVKTLVRSNPVAFLFPGSPLYALYLRALGAKIGPRVAIFSRRVPVCTDLLTVGADTVVRRESTLLCYRARAGRIETGPVTLGRDVLVGERSVLDIDTSMGDGAQLGHASGLESGQAVPADERWHGCPAERTDVNYLRVAPARSGRLQRAGYSISTLFTALVLVLPLLEVGIALLLSAASSLSGVLVGEALSFSLLVFFSAVLGGLALVVTVPRLLNLFLKPDRAYPLYGFHDRLHRVIVRLTGLKFFVRLFGDSSYIVHYLRLLGYKLSPVEQTGSNFGIQVVQANPARCSVGTGTMVADGLIMANEEISSTSFCVSRASIGRRSFVGNDVTYPPGGRTGENCLLATKAMIPLDGPIREGVGLLGAPPFEIPRSVERDSRFDHLRTGDALRRGLAAKNRHNLRSIGTFILVRWLAVFLAALLGTAALEARGDLANVPMALLFALSFAFTPFYLALAERCTAGFRSLQPTYCSIYDRRFWQNERLWKVIPVEFLRVFDGTPFKNVIWRLMGVRVGRRVFDNGVHISERTLTTLGDDCVLNAHSKILCHSQEDGTFKSDRSTIGSGCTVGVGALVHYGVTMGNGSILAADSFLMKGEEMPARARWGGNPAAEVMDGHR